MLLKYQQVHLAFSAALCDLVHSEGLPETVSPTAHVEEY